MSRLKFDRLIRTVLLTLLLILGSACGWVDSTGTQPEIAQLGATGNTSDNTVALLEQTRKILDLASQTNSNGLALQTQSFRKKSEGGLAECAALFDTNDSPATLNDACTPDETSCSLLIVPVDANGTDQYSLHPPKLSLPIGLKYDWQFSTSTGSIENIDVTFCIDAINEAPKATNDTYSIVAQGSLVVGGRTYDENCQYNLATSSLLDNDIDDADWRLGCLQTILVTPPQFADNDFASSFTNGGGFVYQPVRGINSSEDRFTYRLYDGEYFSEKATVVISLLTSATAPQAMDDQYTVARNSGNSTFFPMSNDVDPEAIDIDIIAIAQQPDQGGSARIEGTNRIFYQPASGFFGVERLQYTIVNSSGERSTATIKVNVI